MALDPKQIERIGPDYWRNSQLSIARHFGAAIINGTKYVLDPVTDYLVREDIWKKDIKYAKKRAAYHQAEKKKWTEAVQCGLFEEAL